MSCVDILAAVCMWKKLELNIFQKKKKKSLLTLRTFWVKFCKLCSLHYMQFTSMLVGWNICGNLLGLLLGFFSLKCIGFCFIPYLFQQDRVKLVLVIQSSKHYWMLNFMWLCEIEMVLMYMHVGTYLDWPKDPY